ncbi:MAG: chorismate synthase [Acidimicrobiia bacterium]|nr:chorismate synthase [Acidimicrobiia bacterium]
MLRLLTAGESHGPGLTTIVEGLPSGLPVSREGLAAELARRRLGYGRGRRMQLEQDEIEFLGGLRFGMTLGSPVSVLVRNTEFATKWTEEMNPEAGASSRPATAPRPGHADLAGMQKYDTHDARDILERASARETAARAVAGYLAKQLLHQVGIDVFSHVVAIGDAAATGPRPTPEDLPTIDASPVRSSDPASESAMVAAIEAAKADRDTLGGIVEVLAYGLPVGVGSHVHYDRRLDALLAMGLMSIQAIKGVEVGDGFDSARRRGSAAHDEIAYSEGEFVRDTDRAGGIEGGMTNGQVVRVRAAMKPISTLMKALKTVDVETKDEKSAIRERSDVCAVPAAGVVAESMVAIVLAQEMQRKFGGDTISDFVAAVDAYRKRIATF